GVVVQAMTLHSSADVNVGQAMKRHSAEIRVGVPAVIPAIGVEVRDVKQQQRVGPLQQLAEEGGLIQLTISPLDESRDVFEVRWATDDAFDRAHVFGQQVHRDR